MRKRGISEFVNASRVLHALVFLGFGIAILLSILSCEDIRVGKTREEINQDLSQTMFEVDSIIMKIKHDIESNSLDSTFYLNVQRINNGHP